MLTWLATSYIFHSPIHRLCVCACRYKPIKKGVCHLRQADDEMPGDPDDEISCVCLETGGPLEPPQDYKYFK